MRWKTAGLKIRLYLASLAVMSVGLCSAALIYVTAEDPSDNALAYEVVNGNVYLIPARSSKTYVSQLKRFGGKTAVLFDELNDWFTGLWQGKSLAFTVAGITVLVSLGIFLFAIFLAPDQAAGVPSKDDRDGRG
ncbi:MAG: hypothetical protein HY017_00145 [Betaproteobacteria bacterium]|nr:hypothetical protein [Betaproteobacteria bacterium]